MPTTKKADRWAQYAQLGAAARLEELERERRQILRDFPALKPSPTVASMTETRQQKNAERINGTQLSLAPVGADGILLELPPVPPPLPKHASKAQKIQRDRIIARRMRMMRAARLGRPYKERQPWSAARRAKLSKTMKSLRRQKNGGEPVQET